MRAVFVMIILAIIFPVIISAQDEVKTKHDAYYLCINNIETKPVNAYGYCSNYLKKYIMICLKESFRANVLSSTKASFQ